MKRKGFNGLALDKGMFEAAMRGCLNQMATDPNLVIDYDIESGFPYLMTKEEFQKRSEMFDSLFPKGDFIIPEGKLIYFGTGGDIDNNDYLKKFYGE